MFLQSTCPHVLPWLSLPRVPHLCFGPREIQSGWQHADHLVWNAIELDAPPDEPRVGTVPCDPQIVADHEGHREAGLSGEAAERVAHIAHRVFKPVGTARI